MEEHIEIEFKNLLTYKEFERLLHYFHLDQKDFFVQKNHYFDTNDFQLKNRHSALRIREKNEQFEMTLKQPIPDGDGLLETNTILTKELAASILDKGTPLPKAIEDKLINMQIDHQSLSCFGTLTTERTELPYENGLIVFDKSSYFQIKDYEVEFEVEDFQKGQAIFKKLLNTLNIPSRLTENKVKRFYQEMIKSKG